MKYALRTLIVLVLLIGSAVAFGGSAALTGDAQAGADMCDPKQGCVAPPPPPPPPPAGTPDYAAYGWHGDITGDGYIRGWACDPNDFNYPIFVHFYANNGRGYHTYMGQTQAGGWWNEGVAGACGGNPWHGYAFRVPENFRNGEGWQTYSYAINICGSSCYQGNPQQYGDGAIFGFGTPPDLDASPISNYASSGLQYMYNDAVCGPGVARKWVINVPATRSRGYSVWNHKLNLWGQWCANSSRTRIVGFSFYVTTNVGLWCGTSNSSWHVHNGGKGYGYVEIFAQAEYSCASLPFHWPKMNKSHQFRYVFRADGTNGFTWHN